MLMESNSSKSNTGIRVIIPGALTTVQDAGRFDYQQAGMMCSGVMDTDAYEAAGYLVGNTDGEAVLEHTVFGGTYLFESDCIIAITGADMKPSLNGSPCPMYRPVFVKAGSRLVLGAAVNGCRTYLGVSGGIDVPVVMGSRSTCMKCRIGGYLGRALCSGDLLPVGRSAVSFEQLSGRSIRQPVYSDTITVRAIAGPQDEYFTDKGKRTFYSCAFTVSDQSDRMGCRLNGPAVESFHGTDIISDGIVFGSVQITSAGQPIILLADRQTTGGYAKIATVCTADLPLLAQARPGSTIHFKEITVEEAQQATEKTAELLP